VALRRRPFIVLLAAAILGAFAAVLILIIDGGSSQEVGTARTLRPTPAPASRTAPKPEAIRDCASRIEGRRLTPMPSRDVVVGPIIFYGLRELSRVAMRDPSHAFRTKNGEHMPIKTITEVRADTVATVAIAPQDRARARLFYRLPFPSGRRALGFRLDEGQAVMRFISCPARKRRYSGRGVVGPRTQFNGGFLFTEPQCLRLDVYDEIRATSSPHLVAYGRAETACRR
jgi:hypothetical protein